MSTEKGTIAVQTENIFPIIKKFLYSDHEIFLRELVSNAVDASQKMRKMASVGEYEGELGDMTISVDINKKAKTITIADKGIGMTVDEVRKYINQVAFPVPRNFWINTKVWKMENPSLVISVWAFTVLSW